MVSGSTMEARLFTANYFPDLNTKSGSPNYVKSLGITELDGAGGQMLASYAWGMQTSMSF